MNFANFHPFAKVFKNRYRIGENLDARKCCVIRYVVWHELRRVSKCETFADIGEVLQPSLSPTMAGESQQLLFCALVTTGTVQ